MQSFLEFVILIVVSTGSLYLKGGDSNGAKSKQPFHYYYTIIRNYYEAWNNCWSVTCGGEWNNTNYGGYINDVGGDDGFGVGYTNSSNPYKSSVVSCSAYLTDANNRYYESTSNRSDGDGSKGFGFRLQDGWQNIGNYVGHKWSGVCTYDNWFGNYNGVATAYYIHTYNEANLKSVTFGKNGTTAGIEANIEAVESSVTALSNDTVFGTYP